MSRTTAARVRTCRTLVAFCLVVVAIVGALGYRSASSSAPPTNAQPGDVHSRATVEADGALSDDVTVRDEATVRDPAPSVDRSAPGDLPPGGDHGATIEADGTVTADGALPDGVTVFDDQYPGVANLDPALIQALRAAATDAADDGVTFHVNSGWRSSAYQNRLLRQAIAEYGSAEEAARWVATADTSAHVSGDAADIGPSDAQVWLSEHGAAYGLCQIYVNEPWHFELLPQTIDRGCPAMYADATRSEDAAVTGALGPSRPGPCSVWA